LATLATIMVNSYYVFDFTAFDTNEEDVKKVLKDKCKKWTFQYEKGNETGKDHYQGRFSLKEKKSTAALAAKHIGQSWHLSITSKTNQDNDYYVTKEETRIAGPWSDKDVVLFIPRHIKTILENLYPWQKSIWETREESSDRHVNILLDTKGNLGKSSLVNAMVCTGKALVLPPTNDSEKLVQSMCDMCKAREERDPKMVFINFPRAMEQDNVSGIYKAIEQIKDGHLYDVRYRYQEWWIESPTVWVICNKMPNMAYLSRDRWRVWEVIDKELQRKWI